MANRGEWKKMTCCTDPKYHGTLSDDDDDVGVVLANTSAELRGQGSNF